MLKKFHLLVVTELATAPVINPAITTAWLEVEFLVVKAAPPAHSYKMSSGVCSSDGLAGDGDMKRRTIQLPVKYHNKYLTSAREW